MISNGRAGTVGWPSVAAALALLCGCHGATAAPTAPSPDGKAVVDKAVAVTPPARAPGELPDSVDRIRDDLYGDAAEVVYVQRINPHVDRLVFDTGDRAWRAKWKAMGERGSEAQDGVEGNNSPRHEAGAWRLSRLLFGEASTARHLVAPVAVRALHRDIPCDRACAGVTRLPGSAGAAATFPELNDHLIVGALTYWVEGVKAVPRFEGDGGLWDRQRWERSAEYRRSFSDLNLFLFIIDHGDANSSSNLLLSQPGLDRVFSIDNGIAFDAPRFYVDGAPKDWDPWRRITLDRLPAPRFSAATLAALAALDLYALRRELRVTAAIDMTTGRSVREPGRDDGAMASLRTAPLAATRLARRSPGVFTGVIDGTPWVVMGLTEKAIDDVGLRAHRAAAWAARRTLDDTARAP